MARPVGVYRRYSPAARRRPVWLRRATLGAGPQIPLGGKPCPVSAHPRDATVSAQTRAVGIAVIPGVSVSTGSRGIKVEDFPSPRKTDVDPKDC